MATSGAVVVTLAADYCRCPRHRANAGNRPATWKSSGPARSHSLSTHCFPCAAREL